MNARVQNGTCEFIRSFSHERNRSWLSGGIIQGISEAGRPGQESRDPGSPLDLSGLISSFNYLHPFALSLIGQELNLVNPVECRIDVLRQSTNI